MLNTQTHVILKSLYSLKSPEMMIRSSIDSGLSCIDYASTLSRREWKSTKQIIDLALKDLQTAREHYASLEYTFSGLEDQINDLEDKITQIRYKG